jgi:uncharacterized protein
MMSIQNEDASALQEAERACAARNFVGAVQLLSPLAKRGNPAALVLLGECLMYGSVGAGKLVKSDYPTAIAMLRRAAALGNHNALFHLGQCADHGRGLARDQNTALDFFRRSAEMGNVAAMCRLGGYFVSGTAMPDHAEAVYWTRRALECGDHAAMWLLARRYLIGRGVPKDLVMACSLYKAGAHNMDDPREPSELAFLFDRLSDEQKAEIESIVASSRLGAPWPLASVTGAQTASKS